MELLIVIIPSILTLIGTIFLGFTQYKNEKAKTKSSESSVLIDLALKMNKQEMDTIRLVNEDLRRENESLKKELEELKEKAK